jgi:hypothetical protein
MKKQMIQSGIRLPVLLSLLRDLLLVLLIPMELLLVLPTVRKTSVIRHPRVLRESVFPFSIPPGEGIDGTATVTPRVKGTARTESMEMSKAMILKLLWSQT